MPELVDAYEELVRCTTAESNRKIALFQGMALEARSIKKKEEHQREANREKRKVEAQKSEFFRLGPLIKEYQPYKSQKSDLENEVRYLKGKAESALMAKHEALRAVEVKEATWREMNKRLDEAPNIQSALAAKTEEVKKLQEELKEIPAMWMKIESRDVELAELRKKADEDEASLKESAAKIARLENDLNSALKSRRDLSKKVEELENTIGEFMGKVEGVNGRKRRRFET
jgi:DNA repair exonuclease SbcCD ATPase subunit